MGYCRGCEPPCISRQSSLLYAENLEEARISELCPSMLLNGGTPTSFCQRLNQLQKFPYSHHILEPTASPDSSHTCFARRFQLSIPGCFQCKRLEMPVPDHHNTSLGRMSEGVNSLAGISWVKCKGSDAGCSPRSLPVSCQSLCIMMKLC